MKNTTKHAGVVAAVLTAAGITSACPGTAFADSSTGQVPANGSALGTAVTQNSGSYHDGERPIVVHGPVLNRAPILDGGPILDRGPGRCIDNDGRGRRFDNDYPIVVRGRIRCVEDLRTRASESQTGTVCSLTPRNIVVSGADGTTWTWTTDNATTVRIAGVKGTLADLRDGDRIQVKGLLIGTTRHAESVRIISRAETFTAPRHAKTFVVVGRAETFVTPHRAQIHRQHKRADRCEHAAGRHERDEHCGHPASSHGRGRGGGTGFNPEL